MAPWMRGDGAESRLPRRIFWVALIVRVLYMTLAHTYRMRVLLDHFEFGWEMGRIARALATGYGYADPFTGHSGPTAWTPPLYPLIIAAAFKLFGIYNVRAAWTILALNSVFSAATAPAVYEIAWRSFGRTTQGLKIALWSGWLWALYPAAMQYAVRWVWDMSLTTLLFAWVLVLALRIRGIGEPDPTKSQTPRPWLIFGLLWGLIALSNSSLLTFLPACGLWIIWPTLRAPRQLVPALRNVTLASICFLAVISPWIIRNQRAFHAFVPMRSNFGAELYEATRFSNDGFPWMATLPLAEAAPEFQRYERLGELTYSKQQGALAMAAIRTHRKQFLKNAIRRVYFFWISVPHPTEDGKSKLSGEFVEATRRLNYSFLSFGGLFGLGLALHRRVPGAWLYLWAFTLLPLIYYFVTVQARFRHPLEPLICILTVYLFQSADRTRTWSWQKPARLAE
jgi:hypothetical protein